ncbi:MAG: sodium-dependent transporter [Arenicella sp.]|nr:sodium-dependent transporter [Arenicella sp.]
MKGVKDGIEKWTSRLMPSLLILILLLTIYVLTLEGAVEGLRVYLIPDFSQILNVQLIVSAMGQAFFSLSLGVGTMLIYGSYVSSEENLPSLARSVTLIDIGIAVLAGMLIVPAIYVAQASGIEVYSETGQLIEGDGLIFNILPALFTSMGSIGTVVSITFFFLLTLAALTSSISMLEVPVSYVVESGRMPRVKAALVISLIIGIVCAIIIVNFESLFAFVVSLTTEYSQPVLGFFLAIYTAWVWSRDKVLTELRSGFNDVETSLFWKVWPFYIKFVCPVAILVVFAQQLFR